MFFYVSLYRPDDGYRIAETCRLLWCLYDNNIHFAVLTYFIFPSYSINTKFKLTVSNFSFFITNNLPFAFVDSQYFLYVDSNSNILLNVQNWPRVHINFFLTMTDTITSQNTVLSSRITLYILAKVQLPWGKCDQWTHLSSTSSNARIIGRLLILVSVMLDLYNTHVFFSSSQRLCGYSIWHTCI